VIDEEELRRARSQWTGVSVSESIIRRHVEEKLRDAAGPIRLPELVLACACAARDAAAIGHFEGLYFGEVDAAVRRFDALPVTREDVQQRMRERLYLHDPPGIAGYSGAGSLRAWLRAATLHLLINIATRETRERPTEELFFDAVVDAAADLEAAYLKEACREEFEEAFTRALARLDGRERLVLRYAFADGQGVDDIGGIFGVHRATAARWVAKARDKLVLGTRRELMATLCIGEGDAASIVRAALSRMGVTLLRRLG
jgi:RNA polymerase sigma-70 factor (ECF subfamily)